MLKKLLRLSRWSLLLTLVALLSLLGVSPFYIYDRFNQEIPVARLEFTALDDNAWIAHLSTGNFCSSRDYPIQGDQFQLDAGFVKWKGLGILLGFEPRYRLDRLSGRYSEVGEQNSRSTFSHDLAPDVLFDFFEENASDGSSGWFMDTSYGSSVYYAIDPALYYTVYATEDALIARAQTRQAYTRENGVLTIEVNRPCGDGQPVIESLSKSLNSLATDVLEREG